jgi:hypothetical protein
MKGSLTPRQETSTLEMAMDRGMGITTVVMARDVQLQAEESRIIHPIAAQSVVAGVVVAAVVAVDAVVVVVAEIAIKISGIKA